MLVDMLPLLLLGCGLGMVHALDADHVMAMSVLSAEKPGLKRTVYYCLHWAIGHGSILVVAGALLFWFGFNVPASLVHVAELGVGLLLIVLGIVLFVKFKKEKLQLREHHHGDIVHRHWHIDEHTEHSDRKKILEAHKPMMVGMLHGLAGSAPVIALIPIAVHGEVFSGLLYVLVFSVGVLLSMLEFGFSLGFLQRTVAKRHPSFLQSFRHIIAGLSIVIGSLWLVQAV